MHEKCALDHSHLAFLGERLCLHFSPVFDRILPVFGYEKYREWKRKRERRGRGKNGSNQPTVQIGRESTVSVVSKDIESFVKPNGEFIVIIYIDKLEINWFLMLFWIFTLVSSFWLDFDSFHAF